MCCLLSPGMLIPGVATSVVIASTTSLHLNESFSRLLSAPRYLLFNHLNNKSVLFPLAFKQDSHLQMYDR